MYPPRRMCPQDNAVSLTKEPCMGAREVFGTRLRRQMLELTPHDLAERLGIGVGSISRYEQRVDKEMTCARLR
jgi:DNA-binding transcriptional regulator YiaG